MKIIYNYFISLLLTQLFFTGIGYAQTINLKAAPANVTIDGNAKEWDNDLSYANDKAKVSYTFSNDKENLYLVIKTNDPEKQGNILGSGISLTIDTKGKKRPSYTISFPVNEAETTSGYRYMKPNQVKEKIEQTNYKSISMEGFADITEKQLLNTNPYGIKAVVGYTPDGYLVYEEAIPLVLFRAADDIGKEWAFNIKINGLEDKTRIYVPTMQTRVVAVSRTGPGSIPPVRGAKDINGITGIPGDLPGKQQDIYNADAATNKFKVIQLTPSVDFWGKFILAKPLP